MVVSDLLKKVNHNINILDIKVNINSFETQGKLLYT